MKSISEIRRNIYEYNYSNYPYLKKFKKNPYTWFKAKLYIEASVILTYLFLKTKIKANTITAFYAVFGILGGVFLAIPFKITIILAIIIFFFKDILDWTDGVVAREKNQTSITGDVLDTYGALTGLVCLWTGIGLYIFNKSLTGITYISPYTLKITSLLFDNFIYFVPLIPAIFALDIITHTKHRLYTNHISKAIKNHNKNKNESYSLTPIENSPNNSNVKKVMQSINKIFEHRARFVDFICLLILLELIFPIFITWIVFFIYLLWKLACFIGFFIVVARGGQAEKYLEDNIQEIYRN